jgi:uncharacterized protein YndB with AHSA1/START domain
VALSEGVLAPTSRVVAVAIATVVATLLYTTACLIAESYGYAFFSIPVFVGFVAGALDPKRPFRTSLFTLLAALLLAIVTFHEGIVCVLFALPVLIPSILLGALTGSTFVRVARSRRAQRTGIGLMVLLGFGTQAWDAATDNPAAHSLHVAESRIALPAPAEQVFAALTEGELAVAPRWPWFIRIGLPIPERMIVEEPGPQGRLRFEFAHMKAYARVTSWEPPREIAYVIDGYEVTDLPFHITRLGRDPDYGLRRERVQDWLTVLEVRYTVAPEQDGGSVLYRRMVWRRHLAPDAYFGWLQQTVVERGQERLLELIGEKIRDDRPGASPGGGSTAMLQGR